jgi:branched-chain amino acid transport system permease protein
VYGADYKALLLPYTFDSIIIGDTIIQVTRLITGLSGMLGLLILHLFITKTWYGMAIRATAQNPMMAEVAGADVKQIHTLVSILAMICLAVSGPLLMLVSTTDPVAGGFYITLAFVVTLIGSPGNLFGAFIGGLVIGLSEVLITWYLGSFVTGFSTFLIFIIVLIIMPYGQRRRN